MNGKLNLRQRAISDYEYAKTKNKSQFSLQLHEGRLQINVARLGKMYPFVKSFFGNEMWKSENSENGGQYPKWNQFHQFPVSNQKTLELIVYDKSYIFGDTEIGRCTIHLNDVVQGHLTEWWDITTANNDIAGAVLLTFEFPRPDSAAMHFSNNSWDLKMHHHVESSPIVARIRNNQDYLHSHRTPDHKITHCSTEPDEVCDLEQLRCQLIEENVRLKNQELKVKQFFGKLKEESTVLKLEKIELKKSKEILQHHEESILSEKTGIENERNSIDREREEILKLKETLNLEYLKLKQEKLKIKTHKKLQEKNLMKVRESCSRLDKQKEIGKKL